MTDSDDRDRRFRARLLAERAALADATDATAGDRDPVALDQQSVGRLSRMDAMQQQAMARAQQGRRAARLRAIDAALARLDDGDFGWCDACGDAIGDKRLELDPVVTRCICCAG